MVRGAHCRLTPWPSGKAKVVGCITSERLELAAKLGQQPRHGPPRGTPSPLGAVATDLPDNHGDEQVRRDARVETRICARARAASRHRFVTAYVPRAVTLSSGRGTDIVARLSSNLLTAMVLLVVVHGRSVRAPSGRRLAASGFEP